jgi:hypothetical protein
MRTRPSLGLLALAFALAAAPPAAAATLAGVTMADRESAGGQELTLNGMGLRKKFFIKVYIGGLYLQERQSSAEKVLAADAPRILRMEFLYGVSKDQMCEAWDEGLEANTPNASAELKKQFETLCGWMEDIDDGQGAEFTYAPGSGTTVSVKGQDKGTIEGKPFADALLRCWIGPDPGPGEGFKNGVLGG